MIESQNAAILFRDAMADADIDLPAFFGPVLELVYAA